MFVIITFLLYIIHGFFHDSSCYGMLNIGGYKDHSKFMSNLPDSQLIRNLALIGTHASASGENKFFQHTQNLTIQQQLASGIRVLDIDVRVIDNKLMSFYGPVSLNISFDQVLTEVHKFLTKNSRELVIMLMRTEYDNQSAPDSKVCMLLDKYIQQSRKYGLSIVKNWSLLDDYIGEHRGKVLLGQFDGKHFVSCTTYLPCEVQNHFEIPVSTNLEMKWNLIKRNADDMMNPYYPYHSCWLNYLSSLNIELFSESPDIMLSDQRYLQIKINTVKEVNKRMTRYFFNQYYTLIMIMADMPSQELIDKIINSNFI